MFTRAFPDYEKEFGLSTLDENDKSTKLSASASDLEDPQHAASAQQANSSDSLTKDNAQDENDKDLQPVYAYHTITIPESVVKKVEPQPAQTAQQGGTPMRPGQSPFPVGSSAKKSAQNNPMFLQQQPQQSPFVTPSKPQQQRPSQVTGTPGSAAFNSPSQWSMIQQAALATPSAATTPLKPNTPQQGIVPSTPGSAASSSSTTNNLVANNNYLMSMLSVFGNTFQGTQPTFFSPAQMKHQQQLQQYQQHFQQQYQQQFQQQQQQQQATITPQQLEVQQNIFQQLQQQIQQQAGTSNIPPAPTSAVQAAASSQAAIQALQSAAPTPKKRGRPRKNRGCSECSREEFHEMLVCVSCKSMVHTSCHDPNLAHVRPEFRQMWRCGNCKICEQCKQEGKEDCLLICEYCDRGFHTFCLQPPLTQIPEGKWICNMCLIIPPLHMPIPSLNPLQNNSKKARDTHNERRKAENAGNNPPGSSAKRRKKDKKEQDSKADEDDLESL